MDTVWRNKDEAVETNGTSYAGNAIMCPDPSGNAKSLYHRKTKTSIMLQRPTEDSWKMARYSWNNFGITANMSRCPRLESRLIWAFSSSDAVGKAWP